MSFEIPYEVPFDFREPIIINTLITTLLPTGIEASVNNFALISLHMWLLIGHFQFR
ncbi:MAG: hypothetical protein N3A01_08635 [Bacteroidales bacterium]|nr:hypothetical protein [Bacteroidales bacterium]